MSTESLSIRVRSVIEEDHPLIFSAWLKSHRYSQSVYGIQNEIYYANHHKVVESLLASCKSIVLCSEQDLSHVYAFGIGEEVKGIFVLHFIYVKQPYRNLGLAKLLFKHLGGKEDVAFCYSHRTKKAEQYDKKHSTGIYHPYLCYRHFKGIFDEKEKEQQEEIMEVGER